MPAESEKEIMDLLSLHIPPGVALNDIFLDTQDMSEQLNSCKRVLNNMRKKGELSYTQFTKKGKVYYLKQEVAATLKKNIVVGKNSPLRKNGPKCISTLMGLFSLSSFDAAELLNMDITHHSLPLISEHSLPVISVQCLPL
ncbi:MAG TPA: hypothetical protein VN726_23155 [Hanamia sp.]|nr:hypothetical protein [Hanamia sp.]